MASEDEIRIKQSELLQWLNMTHSGVIENLSRDLKQVVETYSKLMQQAQDENQRRQEDEAREKKQSMILGQVQELTSALTERLTASLNDTLGNIENFRPGFEKTSNALGKIIGGTIALALTVGGTLAMPGVGTAAGAAAGVMAYSALSGAGGSIAGFINNVVGMQVEGYEMLGARMAPRMAGGGPGSNFDSLGRSYVNTMLEIRKSTGETGQVTSQLLERNSQYIGKIDGSTASLAKMTIQYEDMLNISRGTLSNLSLDVATKYGQGLEGAKVSILAVADAQRMMEAGAKNTQNEFFRVFSQGQNIAEALGQISSQARNSGAAFEDITSAAALFLRTIGGAEGGGQLMRGEAATRTVGNLIGGFLPQETRATSDEFTRSGIMAWTMTGGGANQGPLNDHLKLLKSQFPDVPEEDLKQRMNSYSRLAMQRGGEKGKDITESLLSGGMMGLATMGKTEHGREQVIGAMGMMGFGGPETIIMEQLIKRWEKEGVDVTNISELRRKAKDDPQYKELEKRASQIQQEAERRAQAMFSMEQSVEMWAQQAQTQFSGFWGKMENVWRRIMGKEEVTSARTELPTPGTSVTETPTTTMPRAAQAMQASRDMADQNDALRQGASPGVSSALSPVMEPETLGMPAGRQPARVHIEMDPATSRAARHAEIGGEPQAKGRD